MTRPVRDLVKVAKMVRFVAIIYLVKTIRVNGHRNDQSSYSRVQNLLMRHAHSAIISGSGTVVLGELRHCNRLHYFIRISFLIYFVFVFYILSVNN